MSRRHILAAAAALVALACGEIGAPTRSDHYEWRFTNGPDTISYHWPRAAHPVRFWVADTFNLPAHTQTAIANWERALLYRDFAGELVADSNAADVIVKAGFPPGGGGILIGRAPECEALTDIDLDFVARNITLPMHIYVARRFDPDLPETQRCFELVMTHEVGHAMGIFRHSTDPDDIMYFAPTVQQPSLRDRQTAEILHQSRVTVTTTRRGE